MYYIFLTILQITRGYETRSDSHKFPSKAAGGARKAFKEVRCKEI